MSNDKMSNENCSHQKCQVTKCQMTAHLVGKSVVEMLNDKMSNDYPLSRKISCSHQKCQLTNDYPFSTNISCSHQKCQMTKCQMTIHLVGKSAVVIRNVK